MPTTSLVMGYVRLALGDIYERSIEKVSDPEEEGPLSGSYAVAARRRVRRGKEGELDDLSEASPSDLGSPFNASESLFALTTHRSSTTSRQDSSDDELNDSSEGEPDETRKAAVKTHRRATLEIQRRLTIARYQSEEELPRLLGNFAAASEIPDKAVLRR